MEDNQGKNLEAVQNMNRSSVIKYIYRQKQTNRINIAQALGMNRTTAGNIVDDLSAWGLIRDIGVIHGKKGRRSIGIELNCSSYVTICARLMRASVFFSIIDIGGQFVSKPYEIHTSGMQPKEICALIKSEISNLIATIQINKELKIIGIGFAVPGPFIKDKGLLTLLSHAPGWEKINLLDEFENIWEYPFFIEHDANCAAYAEWWYQKQENIKSPLLFLCAGPGIGAGIIVDGKIFDGAVGIAGEIGHMSINFSGPLCECGHRGCLELYASTYALINEIKTLLNKGYSSTLSSCDILTISNILQAVNQGDELAVKAFDRISYYLGFGLVNLVNTYNPGVIYIGDILCEVPERLLSNVKDVLRENLNKIIYDELEIKVSHFKSNELFLLGVNYMVFNNIVENHIDLFNASVE